MHTYIRLFALAVALAAVSVILTSAAFAEQVSFSCTRKPATARSIKEALQIAVTERVNLDLFDNVKVKVRMKQISSLANAGTVDVTQLLGGLQIQDSGHPTGLSFGVDGTVGLETSGVCNYTYRVTISASAVDRVNGGKIKTSTSSLVQFTSPPLGRIRRVS